MLVLNVIANHQVVVIFGKSAKRCRMAVLVTKTARKSRDFLRTKDIASLKEIEWEQAPMIIRAFGIKTFQ